MRGRPNCCWTIKKIAAPGITGVHNKLGCFLNFFAVSVHTMHAFLYVRICGVAPPRGTCLGTHNSQRDWKERVQHPAGFEPPSFQFSDLQAGTLNHLCLDFLNSKCIHFCLVLTLTVCYTDQYFIFESYNWYLAISDPDWSLRRTVAKSSLWPRSLAWQSRKCQVVASSHN